MLEIFFKYSQTRDPYINILSIVKKLNFKYSSHTILIYTFSIYINIYNILCTLINKCSNTHFPVFIISLHCE